MPTRDRSCPSYQERPLRSLRRGTSDPLRFLSDLAERGDFVPFTLAGRRGILLNRPDYVEQVLVSHASKFGKSAANQRARHLLGNGLLTAEGQPHAERRRLIQPAFGRQRLEAYAPVIVARAARLRESWRDGDAIDVARTMGQLTFGIVGEALVGANVDAFYEDVRDATRHATATLDALVSLVAPLRLVRAERTRLHAIVGRLLEASASADAGGLLAMLGAHDGLEATEQLSDDLLTILLAGHDTITNALTFCWLLLAEHPDVEAKLHEELSAVLHGRLPAAADLPQLMYARSVLAEALRLYPPAWVIARRALEDHEVEGGVISKGCLVLVSPYLLHRDRRYFQDPLVFDPERWLGARPALPKIAYFPFGAGPRSCIGEGFAWMEGVLILAVLAGRWRLRADGAFPALDPRITLRPREDVWMRAGGRVGQEGREGQE